jgi:hypothetical protein
MKTIAREEAAKILTSSTPQQLAELRKEARKSRGPRVACDGWLSPLTIAPRKTGPLPNKSGEEPACVRCWATFGFWVFCLIVFLTTYFAGGDWVGIGGWEGCCASFFARPPTEVGTPTFGAAD